MFSTVEVSHSAIRVVQCSRDSVEEIDEFPVPEGADPINSLGTISLSGSLGAVRLILHHDDFMLGSMVQAPCPEDRLAKLIEFEMNASLGEQAEQSLINWYVTATGGASGEMRILTAVTKHSLIERIEEALKVNKGRLQSLVPAGLGLFECWKQQGLGGNALLLDIGGHHTHVAIVEEGELLFLRSAPIGASEVVKDIAELRSIDQDAARELVGKLNKNTPDDIKEIIVRHAAAIAQQVNNVLRFARAQLKLKDIAFDRIYFSGAAGRLPFLIDSCARQLNAPAVVFNPYPRAAVSLPPSQMDAIAELPSGWAPALGTAQADTVRLDGLHQRHRETRQFRETSGILRLAAVLSVAMLVWAFINQQLTSSSIDDSMEVLQGENDDGLIPVAETQQQQINNLQNELKSIRSQASFIDGERRPGRITHELLAAITSIQDQNTCPISLQSMTVERPGQGLVVVEIHGRAQSVDRLDTATVISRFTEQLAQRFPYFTTPMEDIQADTANTPNGYHAFAYRLTFPDNM